MLEFEQREIGYFETPDGRIVHVVGVEPEAMTGPDIEVVPSVDRSLYVLIRKELIDIALDQGLEQGLSLDDAAFMVMNGAARYVRKYLATEPV